MAQRAASEVTSVSVPQGAPATEGAPGPPGAHEAEAASPGAQTAPEPKGVPDPQTAPFWKRVLLFRGLTAAASLEL